MRHVILNCILLRPSVNDLAHIQMGYVFLVFGVSLLSCFLYAVFCFMTNVGNIFRYRECQISLPRYLTIFPYSDLYLPLRHSGVSLCFVHHGDIFPVRLDSRGKM